MDATYANMADQLTTLRGLSSLFVVLLNGSAGLPADILSTTMAQLVTQEIAVSNRYLTRPVYNPSPSILNTAKKRHELSMNIAIPTDSTSLTFDRIAVISGGSSARGSTTGILRYIQAVAVPVTIAANQPGVIQAVILSGGVLTDFSFP